MDRPDHPVVASPPPPPSTSPTAPAAVSGDQQPRPDTEVQRVAREAASAVSGVHALGRLTRRRLASAMGRVPGSRTALGAGVNAETGPTQTAIDLAVVVDYGVVIPEVSRQVQLAVVAAVPAATGLEVVEVNVDVIDVHVPGDPEPGDDLVETEPVAEPVADTDDESHDEDPRAVDANADADADTDVVIVDGLADAVAADVVDRLVETSPDEPIKVTETVTTTTVIEPHPDDAAEQPATDRPDATRD